MNASVVWLLLFLSSGSVTEVERYPDQAQCEASREALRADSDKRGWRLTTLCVPLNVPKGAK